MLDPHFCKLSSLLLFEAILTECPYFSRNGAQELLFFFISSNFKVLTLCCHKNSSHFLFFIFLFGCHLEVTLHTISLMLRHLIFSFFNLPA